MVSHYLPALVIIIVMVLLSIEDIRFCRISILPVMFLAGFGLCLRICIPETESLCYLKYTYACTWNTLGLALLPGIGFMICSFVTRGGIGSGDAILLLSLGCIFHPVQLLWLIGGALLCSFFVAVILFLKKRSLKKAFPFVPCLTLSLFIGIWAAL